MLVEVAPIPAISCIDPILISFEIRCGLVSGPTTNLEELIAVSTSAFIPSVFFICRMLVGGLFLLPLRCGFRLHRGGLIFSRWWVILLGFVARLRIAILVLALDDLDTGGFLFDLDLAQDWCYFLETSC